MLSLDEALTVIMPLSARQILVGSTFSVQLTQAAINQQLAACSLDFFISSRRDDETIGLGELIGTRGFGLEQDVLNEKDVDFKEPQVVVRNPASVVIRTPFGRFGDAIKKILVAIVKETVDPAAADRIESIVVAGNVQAALKSIWNRSPTDSEVQAAELGAMELLKSGSEWKCRVIVPRDLAGVLVQPGDALKKLEAARLIKMNLGRAYYIDFWVRQCPQIFEQLELDFWGQITSKVAFRAASFYFGGLASARHELELPPGGNGLQALASDLRLGFAGLQVARQRYFVHKNLDHLISEAVQYVQHILVSMAYVCGFLEAKNDSMARDTDAAAVLLNEGLLEWSILYSKDLRRHYEKRNRWSSEQEIAELGEHVDRLLWTKGIVVSRLDEGCWIDVFGDEQMPMIKQVLSV
jgi:hypothetical protein